MDPFGSRPFFALGGWAAAMQTALIQGTIWVQTAGQAVTQAYVTGATQP